MFHLRDSQRPPPPEATGAEWRSWLFLGGRGAGKTRAGAEWISSLANQGTRLALIGPSLHDVREVMIEGPSGLRAVALADNRPTFEVSRRRVRWPKGGVAYTFSAEDPESLRGPQFHHAWADEFCAWKRPDETLAMLRMGLRLGEQPKLCVTTTPKPIAALRRLMSEPGVALTRAATAENDALPPAFLEGLHALYGGTRLAAQELEGLVVDGDGRALWRAEDIERCYGPRPDRFDEIVVALDPPASSHGDACGIVAAGRLDGVVLGFTDHDRPLLFDGVLCRAQSGLTQGAADGDLGQASAAAVSGILSSDTITADDVAAGLYDAAEIAEYMADWSNPAEFVRLGGGRLARLEARGGVTDDASFIAHVEGPLAQLDRVVGRRFGFLCDAALGDARCGLDPLSVAGQSCDKRYATCLSTFHNRQNFRGFPDLPGEDFLTVYPRGGDIMDGSSRAQGSGR